MIIFILSIFIYLIQPINTSRVVFIPKGSVSEIISYLSNRNFNVSSIDKYMFLFLGHIQSGWIDIGQIRLTRLEFLKQLTVAKAALTQITLVPGETTEIFLNTIAKQLKLNPSKLKDEYYLLSNLEDGFLIPNTYKIPIGISERHLAYFLVNISKKTHKDLQYKLYGAYDIDKWRQVLIIASIIQKEAANNEEMRLVSSVIYNRLKKSMPLQMDGTLNYGPYSHVKITAERIREDKSGFNTYINSGLPPYPVCCVSISAIKAALNPVKSRYLYFVLDRKNKKHIFSRSLKEHNSNIR